MSQNEKIQLNASALESVSEQHQNKNTFVDKLNENPDADLTETESNIEEDQHIQMQSIGQLMQNSVSLDRKATNQGMILLQSAHPEGDQMIITSQMPVESTEGKENDNSLKVLS